MTLMPCIEGAGLSKKEYVGDLKWEFSRWEGILSSSRANGPIPTYTQGSLSLKPPCPRKFGPQPKTACLPSLRM